MRHPRNSLNGSESARGRVIGLSPRRTVVAPPRSCRSRAAATTCIATTRAVPDGRRFRPDSWRWRRPTAGSPRFANDLDVDEEGGTGFLLCEGDHTGPGSLVLFDPGALTVRTAIPTGVFHSEMTDVPRP